MPCFDTPPVNPCHSFLTIFWVFSSASLPFSFFVGELELSYFDFIVGGCSCCASCSPILALFWPPGHHWSDPRAQNSVKTNVFLTFQKSLRGALERLRAAQRCPRGVLLIFARGPERAFGDPKIPHRTPWGPRSGPGGGEQGLRNNKMRIYSGQGFRNEKTLPVATTDTFFQECCCGCYGKQSFPARKLTLPSLDAHENPPRVPPRTCWCCSLQPPFHTGAGTAREITDREVALPSDWPGGMRGAIE